MPNFSNFRIFFFQNVCHKWRFDYFFYVTTIFHNSYSKYSYRVVWRPLISNVIQSSILPNFSNFEFFKIFFVINNILIILPRWLQFSINRSFRVKFARRLMKSNIVQFSMLLNFWNFRIFSPNIFVIICQSLFGSLKFSMSLIEFPYLSRLWIHDSEFHSITNLSNFAILKIF